MADLHVGIFIPLYLVHSFLQCVLQSLMRPSVVSFTASQISRLKSGSTNTGSPQQTSHSPIADGRSCDPPAKNAAEPTLRPSFFAWDLSSEAKPEGSSPPAPPHRPSLILAKTLSDDTHVVKAYAEETPAAPDS